MTSTNWEVYDMKVSTTTSDHKADSLYANGAMQVPVVVSIKVRDKITKKPCTLQDEDLNKIELIDYYRSNTLSDGWWYTGQKNLFSNRINTSAATVSLVGTGDSPDTKKLWVSTTKVENKNIAARIKQPDDTTVVTNGSKYESSVTLTGITPVAYTTDNVDFVQERINNGTYKYEEWYTPSVGGPGAASYADLNWEQDNYFVSSKVHKFVKVDIHGYDPSGFDSGHPGDSRLRNCYSYCVPFKDYKNLKLSFIWDFGAETTKDAGLYLKKTRAVEHGHGEAGFIASAFANIKINQKINALCLTHLAMDGKNDSDHFNWGSEWSSKICGFTVYDMYGNTGKFSAGYSSLYDGITIHNAN